MIYSTFANVQSEYEYLQKSVNTMTKYATHYITAVLREVGTIEVTVDNKPTIITIKGKTFSDDEHIAIYQNVLKERALKDFSLEEQYAICKEIRNQHLVEEYGDDEEKEKSNEPA